MAAKKSVPATSASVATLPLTLRQRLEKELPDAGERRWWRVTLPKPTHYRRKTPIMVELMESFRPGRRAMSEVLARDYTIADAASIIKCAEEIANRVEGYHLVVGEYGGEAVVSGVSADAEQKAVGD